MGVDVGVGVESVGGPDGGECDGVVLASEDGPEVPYMPREGWSAGEGVGVGRKEIYMYALTKPHGPCRGSSGSDMHKQIKQNQNRDIKHPTA